VKKARKDDSVEKSRADIDTTMHDAGAHTDSVPRSAKWAVFNFSFARFAPDHQDEAFPGVLLREMESMIPCECALGEQESKSKSRNTKTKQPLPSLEELGFVAQEGNIIHRTYQKLRILCAHYISVRQIAVCKEKVVGDQSRVEVGEVM
jgi:hypothetical protein